MSHSKYIIISALTIVVSGLLTILNLSEYYKVGILQKTDGYPFGGEGPAPYYYQTAALYSRVNLIWGLLFLLILCCTIYMVINGHRTKMLLTFVITMFLLLTLFIQGQI